MNFLTGEHEFYDIRLVEESDTFIYEFWWRGEQLFCETVAFPSARELTDAILGTIKEV